MTTDKRREARLHRAVSSMSRALWLAEEHPPDKAAYWRDALKAARKVQRMTSQVYKYKFTLAYSMANINVSWCERRMKELGVKP